MHAYTIVTVVELLGVVGGAVLGLVAGARVADGLIPVFKNAGWTRRWLARAAVCIIGAAVFLMFATVPRRVAQRCLRTRLAELQTQREKVEAEYFRRHKELAEEISALQKQWEEPIPIIVPPSDYSRRLEDAAVARRKSIGERIAKLSSIMHDNEKEYQVFAKSGWTNTPRFR